MIHVGISEIKYAGSSETLIARGLGSCIGIVIYNKNRCQAGMAHIMLPNSSLAKNKQFPPGKFADTAIPELIRVITEEYAIPLTSLKAKMAGGAEMFRTNKTNPVSIGRRNEQAVRSHLAQFGIPIIAAAIGGHLGRTVIFNPETGCLMVQTLQQNPMII